MASNDDLVARLRAFARYEHTDFSVAAEAADAIEALRRDNGRLRALLTSYRLAVRGIPEIHLDPSWYGTKAWAAALIHLRTTDTEE